MSRTKPKLSLAIGIIFFPVSCGGYTCALAETATTAQEAGARYGEALGAVEICDGTSLTEKAKNLKAGFVGTDLDQFSAQASKIYDAWITVKNCVRPNDPNPCRIIIQKSCLAAISEIGPSGSALPGLLDVMDH